MHFEQLKDVETKILTNGCDCHQDDVNDITSVVDEVVELTGIEQ